MNVIAEYWWLWGLLTLAMLTGGWAWRQRQQQEVQAQFVVATTGFVGCVTVCYMIAMIVGVVLTGISLLMRFFWGR